MLKVCATSYSDNDEWQWVYFYSLQKGDAGESAPFELARIDHQKASQVYYCEDFNYCHSTRFRVRIKSTSESGSESNSESDFESCSESDENNCFLDLMKVFPRPNGTFEVKPVALRKLLVRGFYGVFRKLTNFLHLSQDIGDWSPDVVESLVRVPSD